MNITTLCCWWPWQDGWFPIPLKDRLINDEITCIGGIESHRNLGFDFDASGWCGVGVGCVQNISTPRTEHQRVGKK